MALTVSLAGCSSQGAQADSDDEGDDTMSVSVSLDVVGDGNLVIPDSGNSCSGSGTLSGIGPDTQVTIEDGSGNPVASGDLGEGTPSTDESACSFLPTIDVEPTGDHFYLIQVGDYGSVRFSAVEMWLVPRLRLDSDGELSRIGS